MFCAKAEGGAVEPTAKKAASATPTSKRAAENVVRIARFLSWRGVRSLVSLNYWRSGGEKNRASGVEFPLIIAPRRGN